MAATGNPSNGHENNFDNYNSYEQQDVICATSNGILVPNNSLMDPSQVAFRYNSSLSVKWSDDEQHILEHLLSKYTSDTIIVRYAKIAQQLNDKTVRDVALRCKWMTVKTTDSLPRSSQVANRSNGPPIDNDDGMSYKDIGGATGQLLEQNTQALDQISANFAAFKDQGEDVELPNQMPPYPVKLNEELANPILPQTSMPMPMPMQMQMPNQP